MDLALATVERATNLTCLVRVIGEGRLTEAHYAKMIQSNFIQIQPRHVVVVDRSRSPVEVVWRVGTMATIVTVDDETVTYHVGAAGGPMRAVNTVPLHDARPLEERLIPVERHDEVMIGPGPEKGVPAILDGALDGRPAHPQRLAEAAFARVAAPPSS